MANKYIIHGATYCGDGTSSAAASSDGGVGAWNNINVFTGTAPAYGALAAGDVVYIRSKDASGANITITNSAAINVGSSAATVANPVKWVVDGGIVWSGVDGVVTYAVSAAASFIIRDNNHIRCDTLHALVFKTTYASSASGFLFMPRNGIFEKLLIDGSSTTGGLLGHVKPYDGTYQRSYLRNCKIKAGILNYDCGVVSVNYTNTNCYVELLNCDIELTASYSDQPVLASGVHGHIRMIGGRVYGVGANSGTMWLCSTANGAITTLGTTYPPTLKYSKIQLQTFNLMNFGAGGSFSGAYAGTWGTADSRNDGNYPTLSAFTPDSNLTPFSWKVYPQYAAKANITSMVFSKLYVGDDAEVDITLQLNFSTTITNLDAGDNWIDISYVDASTGLMASATSRVYDGSTLASSDVTWSLPSYGAISLNKRKITVSLPTAVKKDTMITVVFCSVVGSVSPNDILFICPDFGVQ